MEDLPGWVNTMKHIIFVILLCFASTTFAQSGGDSSIDDIEGLFKEEEAQDERRDDREAQRASERRRKKEEAPDEIEDLKKLETFSDIAVIQKRYLPKTKRFEFFIAGATNLNDAFFVGNGLNARLGYSFTEKWSVEGMFSYIQNDNRDVTSELLERGVTTDGSVSTDSYMGLDLKWTPIYGKYSYFNEKIIPFDLYFTLGFGQTDPRVGSSSAGTRFAEADSSYTIKLGTGQIFALTKWMAFRWDMSFHMIHADTTVRLRADNSIVSQDSGFNNNLFLSVGLSFFFPEANYR